jgi:hypothetical protein
LKVNGESIYATRPYLRYHEGVNLRFTRSKDKKYVYIISLVWPGDTLRSKMVKAKPGSTIQMLGYGQNLNWHEEGDTLVVDLPEELQTQANRPSLQAYAFKVESEDWDKFASTLPYEPPLPSPKKKKASTAADGTKLN